MEERRRKGQLSLGLGGAFGVAQGAGMRGSRLRGNDGGRFRGEISILWLNLALLAPFTPSGEAENEATVASFGTPLTPTHCAIVALDVATVASLGVANLNSVAFGCIQLHSLSPNPHPRLLPWGVLAYCA